MERCESCGTMIGPGTDFCPRCGERGMPHPRCETCGAGRIEGTEFCHECGACFDNKSVMRYDRRDNIALILALLPGLFGLTGLGHIYKRHLLTGALLVAVGLGLRISLRLLTGNMEIVAIGLLLGSMALYSWQVLDIIRDEGPSD